MRIILQILVLMTCCWPIISSAQGQKKPVEVFFYERATELTETGYFIRAEQDKVFYTLTHPMLLSPDSPDIQSFPLGGLEQITMIREGAKGKGRRIGTAVGLGIGALVGLPLILSDPNPDIDQSISGPLIGGLFWGTATILGFTIGGEIGRSKKFFVLNGADEFLPVEMERLNRMSWFGQ
ncbi:MAG: hypothetical protein AAF598_00505 [Bacteroidota bacterium]